MPVIFKSNTDKVIYVSMCCFIIIYLSQVTLHTKAKCDLPSLNKTSSNNVQHNLVNSHISVRLFEPADSYYDASYWEYQRPMGEMGGILEEWKFREYITPGSKCIDFGAGGGFLLNRLQQCGEKIGIELNPHAVRHAKETFAIKLLRNIDLIPDNWADIIISNHALEHTLCPWCELKRLHSKLKKETGKLVFVVPAAGKNDAWAGSLDVNNHIYSWSPNTLGNLVSSAGYSKVKVDILTHQWPDNAMNIFTVEGEAAFIQKGTLKNSVEPLPGSEYQLRVIAEF